MGGFWLAWLSDFLRGRFLRIGWIGADTTGELFWGFVLALE